MVDSGWDDGNGLEVGDLDESSQPWRGSYLPGMAMPWLATGFMGPMAWPATHGPAYGAQRTVSQSRMTRRRPQKERFCATWPEVGRCRHGASCAFAHAREEVCAPLLSPEEEICAPGSLTHEFFTERFKTLWCPIGAQHDWQACMYAHTYQDVRRPPAIGYGHQLCPYWNKRETNLSYAQRCPLGPRCPYAHGAKEQLYHPSYFRTLVCRDLQRRRCPRGHVCAFFHRQSDAHSAVEDTVEYATPLSKDNLPAEWLEYFMNPPRFQDANIEDANAEAADGFMAMPQQMMSAMAYGSRVAQAGHASNGWHTGNGTAGASRQSRKAEYHIEDEVAGEQYVARESDEGGGDEAAEGDEVVDTASSEELWAPQSGNSWQEDGSGSYFGVGYDSGAYGGYVGNGFIAPMAGHMNAPGSFDEAAMLSPYVFNAYNGSVQYMASPPNSSHNYIS